MKESDTLMRGRHRVLKVRLTRKQARFLLDALDLYENGLEQARDETCYDEHESFDSLLDVASGYSEDKDTIQDIRRKVHNVLGE